MDEIQSKHSKCLWSWWIPLEISCMKPDLQWMDLIQTIFGGVPEHILGVFLGDYPKIWKKWPIHLLWPVTHVKHLKKPLGMMVGCHVNHWSKMTLYHPRVDEKTGGFPNSKYLLRNTPILPPNSSHQVLFWIWRFNYNVLVPFWPILKVIWTLS
jgi:hypothetical protein